MEVAISTYATSNLIRGGLFSSMVGGSDRKDQNVERKETKKRLGNRVEEGRGREGFLLMGTVCSKAREPGACGSSAQDQVDPNDVCLRGTFSSPSPPGSSDRSRTCQMRFSASYMPGRASDAEQTELSQADLQASLEKLDEERHSLQEQLRRMQAIELYQDGGDSNLGEDGHTGTRVRFSRAEGDKDAAVPAKPPKQPSDRRNSCPGGASRITSYVKAEHRHDNADHSASLMEMITRSRRRTRFNHRSIEGRTSGA